MTKLISFVQVAGVLVKGHIQPMSRMFDMSDLEHNIVIGSMTRIVILIATCCLVLKYPSVLMVV